MNELLTLVTAVISTLGIVCCLKLGRSRLYTLILVFLFLVSTVGGKVIPIFGLDANAGNVFYAAAYLATYFLVERYGKRAGIYSVWLGAIGVTFFVILRALAVVLVGSPETATLNAALSSAYVAVPRVALASVLAYIISQSINVHLFVALKERANGANLWWRANVANAVSQLVDSAVFFPAAFGGLLLHSRVLELILTGLAIKILYMMLAAPLLYLNDLETDEDGDGSSSVSVTTWRMWLF